MGESNRRKKLDPNYGKPTWTFKIDLVLSSEGNEHLQILKAIKLVADFIPEAFAFFRVKIRGKYRKGIVAFSGDKAMAVEIKEKQEKVHISRDTIVCGVEYQELINRCLKELNAQYGMTC